MELNFSVSIRVKIALIFYDRIWYVIAIFFRESVFLFLSERNNNKDKYWSLGDNSVIHRWDKTYNLLLCAGT